MIALHYYLVVPIKKTTDKNKKRRDIHALAEAVKGGITVLDRR